MKLETEPEEEGVKRDVSMERKAGKKIESLLQPNQNTILKNIWYYFKRYGKSTMKSNYQKIKSTSTIEK